MELETIVLIRVWIYEKFECYESFHEPLHARTTNYVLGVKLTLFKVEIWVDI